MFSEIAYYNILGISVVIYGGIFTLTSLILTFIFGLLVHRGTIKYPVHKWFGMLTLISAIMHGFLAFAARFIG